MACLCTPLPRYLIEMLTPSNPILHTLRLRTMFAGWKSGMAYGHNILFYEEWNDGVSHLMLEYDGELKHVPRTRA